MCLRIDSEVTKHTGEWLNRRGFKKVWKVVDVYRGRLFSPYMRFKWKGGVNNSGRRGVKLSVDESILQEISRGFHVYLTYRDAVRDLKWFDKSHVVVPMIGRLEDFVVAGRYYGADSAVFRRLEIESGEIKRVRNRVRNRVKVDE